MLSSEWTLCESVVYEINTEHKGTLDIAHDNTEDDEHILDIEGE